MDWRTVADALFPAGHTISETDNFLGGEGRIEEYTVAVVGTTGHAPIGVEIALAQAQAILNVVREHPGRPVLLLVDTQGQRLRHRDEMLGINSYMAHLGKCVDLARRRGHLIIGLVYDQALSGGFITSGLMADGCYAPARRHHPRDGIAGDGAHHQGGGRTPDRTGQIQPGVRTRSGKLRAHGRPAGNLARRSGAAVEGSAWRFESGDVRAALGQARGGRMLAQRVMAAIVAGNDALAP